MDNASAGSVEADTIEVWDSLEVYNSAFFSMAPAAFYVYDRQFYAW
jgi:hypothetical protein